jgi:hypothetical protein
MDHRQKCEWYILSLLRFGNVEEGSEDAYDVLCSHRNLMRRESAWDTRDDLTDDEVVAFMRTLTIVGYDTPMTAALSFMQIVRNEVDMRVRSETAHETERSFDMTELEENLSDMRQPHTSSHDGHP